MQRVNPRLLIGVLLVLGGVLSLLDVQGVISNAGGIFWGLIWGVLGLYFVYLLLATPSNWWAVFPAFIFLGFSVSAFLPASLDAYKGLALFTGISLVFWWIYYRDRERWWAIIPAGILLTLGIVSVLDAVSVVDTGGSFFLGLGVTFLLVAILPGGSTRSWALIPGIILLLFGALLGTPFQGFADYLWPAVLIVLGGYLIVRFLRHQSTD